MMRWNERDLFNDEGVIVRKKTALSELPTGASMSHPDATDEVLISFKAECNGVVFDQTEGDKEWVTLGSGRLPVGAEVAIVREGIRGGKMELVLSGAYGFGEAGLQPHVGCNETVTYNVELHDWNNVRDMYDDGSVIVRYGRCRCRCPSSFRRDWGIFISHGGVACSRLIVPGDEKSSIYYISCANFPVSDHHVTCAG
jgi:hypothetical protein